MRIEELHYFIEVAKCKSLSAAAENLHISQQALSSAIKRMEQEIAAPLLVRNYRGVSLSEAGTIMAKGANLLLTDYEMLLQHVRGNSNAALDGTVRIGITYGLMEAYFADILAQLYSENRKINLLVEEMTEQKLVTAVQNGQLDLGLVCFNRGIDDPCWLQNDQLTFAPLFSSRLYIRVAKHSPLAGYNSISLKTALKEKILVYQPTLWEQNPIYEMLLHFTAQADVSVEPNFQLHYQKLVNGLGISFAIQREKNVKEFDQYAKLRLIPLKENIEAVNGYVTSLTLKRAPQVQYVLNYLQMLCLSNEQD